MTPQVTATHGWLLDPLSSAITHAQCSPFFEWLSDMSTVDDFKPVATQLFHHSAAFPRAIGLILSRTGVDDGKIYKLYAQHAYEEADHHLMLLNWMCERGLLSCQNDIKLYPPTVETSNCINLAYEVALAGDHCAWICAINTAIELCSLEFFKPISTKMHRLGVGDVYFDVHVTSDAEHGAMGLDYLPDNLANHDKARLLRKALHATELWYLMIHSWLELEFSPVFIRGRAHS